MTDFGDPDAHELGSYASDLADEQAQSFTCPRCGRTSYHPRDVEEGYCGACHDWTTPR